MYRYLFILSTRQKINHGGWFYLENISFFVLVIHVAVHFNLSQWHKTFILPCYVSLKTCRANWSCRSVMSMLFGSSMQGLDPSLKTPADIHQTLPCTHPAELPNPTCITAVLCIHICGFHSVCGWSSCVISNWAELCRNVGGRIMCVSKKKQKGQILLSLFSQQRSTSR